MNLHAIASGAISAINPPIAAALQRSTGYTTNADGSQTPTYETLTVQVQAQSLTYNDIMHIDSMNLQGVRRALYLTGVSEGIVRVAREGGDVLTFPTGTFPEGDVWLCAMVLESWSQGGWSKIAIVLQNGS